MAFDTSIPFKIERFGVFQNITVTAKAGASAVPAQASPFCLGCGLSMVRRGGRLLSPRRQNGLGFTHAPEEARFA